MKRADLPKPPTTPLIHAEPSYDYGVRSSGESHGVVLTKPHIVELILDLVQYTADRDLAALRLLEPACGRGAFLLSAVRRLLASARAHGRNPEHLTGSLCAVDVDPAQVEASRQQVLSLLLGDGVSQATAQRLSTQWIVHADFLLFPVTDRFDVVVGNPPYVRIEQIPPALQIEYRSRFVSLYDRADLYVAFIERGLSLLSPDGVLSFICADRWTRNRYGAPLRRLITNQYAVRYYLDLSQTSPFDSEVSAYPSIFVIAQKTPSKQTESSVPVVTLHDATEAECQHALRLLRSVASQKLDVHSETDSAAAPLLQVYDRWFKEAEPWVFGDSAQCQLLRKLENEHPCLMECPGVRIGIGVATGNDSIYILSREQAAELEPDRVLPLVMRQDLVNGGVRNGERFVINTFAESGQPISLLQHPRLHSYFLRHEAAIRRRHVAKRSSTAWFRTIDRVYPELARRPKLLIPDIASALQVSYDPGEYYPHHNLYFLTVDSPDGIDLEVLGGLLSSKVALFFIWAYAVKLRGGYLRFQAQYLRRIRIPKPETLAHDLQERIRHAFRKRDFQALDQLALAAYNLPHLPRFPLADKRK